MLLAATSDTLVRNAGIAALVVLAVGVIGLFLLGRMIARVLVLLVAIVVAGLIWTQRSSLRDCADKVKAEASGVAQGSTTASSASVTCSFFGRDVKVSTPTP